MRGLRLLATFAAALLLLQNLAGPAAAQYATGLPPGVVAAEVDGQPIDAANTPTTGETTPVISGRINTGQPLVDIGIGNGEIQRFQTEADAKGRFKARPSAPLQPGQYSLYLFDALVGTFIVTGDGTDQGGGRDREKASTTDVARLVPFPADFYGIYPELGLLDGRYYSADEEALRTAIAAGDASEEAVAAARAGLRDAGWVQRYESRLAVPDPNDRTRFAIQVNSSVIEYKDEASAQAAFGAALTGNDLRPDVAVGTQSELTLLTGTTPDTGATYTALRNVFVLGRFVCLTVLADLSGGEPSQDAVLSAALTAAGRVVQLDSGQVIGAAPKALRLDLPDGAAVSFDESYQAIDGQIVPLYDESQKNLAAREAAFTGTYEDFVGGVAGTVEDSDPPLEFVYGSTISLFPTPEDASAWLAGLPDLIANTPLGGYSAFDPVPDAPVAGEASATYAVSRKSDAGPLTGFRIYTRVGADVATLEFASNANSTLEDLKPLVDAQVACLEAGACAGPAELPGGKPKRDEAGREPAPATPEPGGGVQDAGGQQPAAPAATEPAVAPVATEPATAPAGGGDATATEPAVRRAGSRDRKDERASETATPEPIPAANQAEPTPTSSGGVRDITPNPTVTGG